MYNSVKRKEPCGPPLTTLLLLPSYPSLSWIILVARIPPSRCDQERALRLDTGVHLKDENGCELIICLTTPFIHLKCAEYLKCAQHSSRHCWSGVTGESHHYSGSKPCALSTIPKCTLPSPIRAGT